MAAVSYDSLEILKNFSDRRGITFPMLADPQSELIQRFGVLNPKGAGFARGMAIPGFFFVSPDGVIRETFFEGHEYARYTGNNLVTKLFPELAEASQKDVPAPHLGLQLSQSDAVVVPGSRVTLVAEVTLPRDVHVYAPGVHGYKPIALELEPIPEAILRPVEYPKSKVLLLPAIHEKVPVFEGKFRILQDVTLAYDRNFIGTVMQGPATGTVVTLKGALLYQACDSRICYPPEGVPVAWEITVKPLDHVRAPAAIQHK